MRATVDGLPRRASAIVAGLFLRAVLVTTVQGAGVWFFAHRQWWAIGTAGLIQFLWIENVRDSVDYRLPGVRLAFVLGGMSGAALVLWLTGL